MWPRGHARPVGLQRLQVCHRGLRRVPEARAEALGRPGGARRARFDEDPSLHGLQPAAGRGPLGGERGRSQVFTRQRIRPIEHDAAQVLRGPGGSRPCPRRTSAGGSPHLQIPQTQVSRWVGRLGADVGIQHAHLPARPLLRGHHAPAHPCRALPRLEPRHTITTSVLPSADAAVLTADGDPVPHPPSALPGASILHGSHPLNGLARRHTHEQQRQRQRQRRQHAHAPA
mmetsp:Transcript_49557/g.124262  ORF Transcript_49557/g.124262 Transcript_49557/m.124262 type:complete len:229 (-) Transcript_49557:101-787(-)